MSVYTYFYRNVQVHYGPTDDASRMFDLYQLFLVPRSMPENCDMPIMTLVSPLDNDNIGHACDAALGTAHSSDAGLFRNSMRSSKYLPCDVFCPLCGKSLEIDANINPSSGGNPKTDNASTLVGSSSLVGSFRRQTMPQSTILMLGLTSNRALNHAGHGSFINYYSSTFFCSRCFQCPICGFALQSIININLKQNRLQCPNCHWRSPTFSDFSSLTNYINLSLLNPVHAAGAPSSLSPATRRHQADAAVTHSAGARRDAAGLTAAQRLGRGALAVAAYQRQWLSGTTVSHSRRAWEDLQCGMDYGDASGSPVGSLRAQRVLLLDERLSLSARELDRLANGFSQTPEDDKRFSARAPIPGLYQLNDEVLFSVKGIRSQRRGSTGFNMESNPPNTSNSTLPSITYETLTGTTWMLPSDALTSMLEGAKGSGHFGSIPVVAEVKDENKPQREGLAPGFSSGAESDINIDDAEKEAGKPLSSDGNYITSNATFMRISEFASNHESSEIGWFVGPRAAIESPSPRVLIAKTLAHEARIQNMNPLELKASISINNPLMMHPSLRQLYVLDEHLGANARWLKRMPMIMRCSVVEVVTTTISGRIKAMDSEAKEKGKEKGKASSGGRGKAEAGQPLGGVEVVLAKHSFGPNDTEKTDSVAAENPLNDAYLYTPSARGTLSTIHNGHLINNNLNDRLKSNRNAGRLLPWLFVVPRWNKSDFDSRSGKNQAPRPSPVSNASFEASILFLYLWNFGEDIVEVTGIEIIGYRGCSAKLSIILDAGAAAEGNGRPSDGSGKYSAPREGDLQIILTGRDSDIGLYQSFNYVTQSEASELLSFHQGTLPAPGPISETERNLCDEEYRKRNPYYRTCYTPSAHGSLAVRGRVRGCLSQLSRLLFALLLFNVDPSPYKTKMIAIRISVVITIPAFGNRKAKVSYNSYITFQ